MVCARSTFFAVMGKKAPAFTVASLAMIMQRRPLTRPRPVTTPAPGRSTILGIHAAYAAQRPSSRNSEPSSSRSLKPLPHRQPPFGVLCFRCPGTPPKTDRFFLVRTAASSASSAVRFACSRADSGTSAERSWLLVFTTSAMAPSTQTADYRILDDSRRLRTKRPSPKEGPRGLRLVFA
jgi:hypothetical protein